MEASLWERGRAPHTQDSRQDTHVRATCDRAGPATVRRSRSPALANSSAKSACTHTVNGVRSERSGTPFRGSSDRNGPVPLLKGVSAGWPRKRGKSVRSSARCTKRAPTSSDSRRRYVVVVASAGIPAGFFEIGPLSRASRRAKVHHRSLMSKKAWWRRRCVCYICGDYARLM